jgi:misacylated tRNA(Ala) deacylase
VFPTVTDAPPTDLSFRADVQQRSTAATVVAVTARGGIILDRTVFYPTGGGQPGDRGHLTTALGRVIPIATAVWDDAAKTVIAHVPADLPPAGPLNVGGGRGLAPGDTVTATLDWDIRYRRMRMHTALHLLSVALPYPVTGGAVGEDEGRLDFDIPDPIEREAVQARLDELIGTDAVVSERWITDAQLDANPALVKTMSVQPPRGSGRIRLVEIAGLDLQPCGGTHVARTSEIGAVTVSAIEKKGKLNRRVRLRFA